MPKGYDRQYLDEIALVMRTKYTSELELAANEPTHIMFGDSGIYQRIEGLVEELSKKYEKQQNRLHKALAGVGKIAQSFGIPALSGAIVGAYFGYSEGNLETALQGAKIGTLYGTLAGITIKCLGATMKSGLRKLAAINADYMQFIKEKVPPNPMIAELAEATKAVNATVKYIDDIGDYEIKAKNNILRLIRYQETQQRNFPFRILQVGIRPLIYYICGSIVNLHPSLDYDKLKYVSMGLVHVGLEETVSLIKNQVKIRTNKKLFGVISDFSEEDKLLLVGGLVNRWFGSSYA